MVITRYNPWVVHPSGCGQMNALQNQLNRVFEDIQTSALRTPAAELTETEDALHLRLELPGMSPS